MVLVSLAAGGAVAGGVGHTFAYNRNGWMTDVQVNQNRRYQRQQVRLSQAEMFREDIRDLVGTSVAKQNNMVLMATLIMGMIAECYVEGPVPDGASEFVTSAYMLCVGTSLLYLVLCAICALRSTALAQECQKDLLTTLVRLPVEEFAHEIEAAANVETVEAFEKQGVHRMLRVPGLSRIFTGDTPPNPQQQREEPSKQGSGILQSLTLNDLDIGNVQQDQVNLEEQRHLEVFKEKEKEWIALSTCAFRYGAMGVGHLLQAYGYFSAAKYYSGFDWSSWIVQFLVVMVDAISASFYMGTTLSSRLLAVALTILAPTAAEIAMRVAQPSYADVICIPLCFLCHTLFNVMGFVQLNHVEFPLPEAENLGCERVNSFEVAAVSTRRRRRWEKQAGKGSNLKDPVKPKPSVKCTGGHKHVMVSFGSGIVVMAWTMTFAWSLYHSFHGTGDNGVVIAAPQHGDRRLQAAMPDVVVVSDVVLQAPSRRFKAHSLACAEGSGCFVANDYLVFQVGDEVDQTRPLTPIPLNVSGAIRDLSLECSKEAPGCNPIALVAGDSGTVVEGGRHNQERLLQTPRGAERFAVQQPREHLFSLHDDGHILQRSPTPQGGWAPMWPVTESPESDLVGLDVLPGGSRLLLFRKSGHIDVLDIDTQQVCDGWRPLPGLPALRAGRAGRGDEAVLLAQEDGAGDAHLIKVQLTGLADACAPHAGSKADSPRLRGAPRLRPARAARSWS